MSYLYRRLLNTLLLFFVLLLVSLIWVVYNYPYTPEDILEDTMQLGKWGILIDIIFVIILGKIWFGKRESKE